MQSTTTKLISTLSFFRFALPGLLMVLFFAGFSYIGVFIEDDPLVMLQGGFDNVYVVGTFYLLAQIIAWIIAFYIFKYSSLFRSKVDCFLIPVLSIIFILFAQIVSYAVIFYVLTGLIIWEVNFMFSPDLDKEFATLIFVMLNTTVIIGLIANITGIYIQVRKFRKNQDTSAREPSTDKNPSRSNGNGAGASSGFEDSISI